MILPIVALVLALVACAMAVVALRRTLRPVAGPKAVPAADRSPAAPQAPRRWVSEGAPAVPGLLVGAIRRAAGERRGRR